jgi:hypothetical protein
MTDRSSSCQQLFTFEQNASRVELFVRIVYWILIGIVLWVYGILAGICLLIQWFHILILGQRNEGLGRFIQGYTEYYVHVMNYTFFFTDKRPNILPEPSKMYEEYPIGRTVTGITESPGEKKE